MNNTLSISLFILTMMTGASSLSFAHEGNDGHMPMNKDAMQGQMQNMNNGGMDNMSPEMKAQKMQMMKEKQEMMKKHMAVMEQRLANIEALLKELVELEKKK